MLRSAVESACHARCDEDNLCTWLALIEAECLGRFRPAPAHQFDDGAKLFGDGAKL